MSLFKINISEITDIDRSESEWGAETQSHQVLPPLQTVRL